MAITYEKIASTTLNASTATVTFSSIPGTYTDLVLHAFAANTGNDADNTGYMQFNSDTGNNYYDTIFYTGGVFRQSPSNAIGLWTIMGSTNSNRYSPIQVNFQNYSNTTTHKSTLNRIATVSENLGGSWVNMSTGIWQNTNAITSILIGGGTNWRAGSTFTLYGILKA